MTATTATVATCPTWCNGRDHIYDRGPKTHPDDAGVSHLSEDVDSWSPADEDNEEDIRVYIDGFRHDNESGEDYPDTIRADNVSPGFMGAVQLHVPDARRLAWALLAACDLAEGTTASRAVSTAGFRAAEGPVVSTTMEPTHLPEPDVPGYCTCGTLTKLCEAQR